MSSSGHGNRLMSIHSMLGTPRNSETPPSESLPRVTKEESRPSSVPTPFLAGQVSPRQYEKDTRDSAFRASSQPPVPLQHESPRYFPPQQHDAMYNLSQHHYTQQQRLSAGSRPASHSQASHFQVHNQSMLNPTTFNSPAQFERAKDREYDREDERRQRDLERERERVDGIRTPSGRYEARPDSTRASSAHAHSHTHHHHHLHHAHPPFRQPKLIIRSHKVFEEAKQYPEVRLGRWTYTPTQRPPFQFAINSTFVVHIPRRFLDTASNSALRRRQLWGTEIYTDDSDLAALLIHTTSKLPRTGDLEMLIRIMPRLLKYKSSMSNDLQSRGWTTKHDGLSFYVENVTPVLWKRESIGKGFTKRSIDEMLYTFRESSLVPVDCSRWRPQKFNKFSSQEVVSGDLQSHPVTVTLPDLVPDASAQEKEQQAEEPEGDDTIELILPDQDTETETSFVQVEKPLITNPPEILPTSLSTQESTIEELVAPREDLVMHDAEEGLAAKQEPILKKKDSSPAAADQPELTAEEDVPQIDPVIEMILAHAKAEEEDEAQL